MLKSVFLKNHHLKRIILNLTNRGKCKMLKKCLYTHTTLSCIKKNRGILELQNLSVVFGRVKICTEIMFQNNDENFPAKTKKSSFEKKILLKTPS